MIPQGILDAIFAEAWGEGQSFAAWGVAWARVLPTALFVPAFGLGVLPVAFRAAVGAMLAVSVVPLLQAPAIVPSAPWPALLLTEFARGVPVALAASVSLWAATVAGGVTDLVTKAPRTSPGGAALFRSGPFSALLLLAATASFLRFGGAERVAERLAAPDLAASGVLSSAVGDLAAGIDVGVTIGAPLLVAGLLFDLATLVAARELWTLRAGSTLASLRSLVLLVAAAALMDRMAASLAVLGRRTP